MLSIAFFGKFNSGKSSLINSLLGRKLVPERSLPTHIPVVVIEYDNNYKIELIDFKNGSVICNSYTEVEDKIKNNNYSKIILKVNHPFLKTGLKIIDTPGIDDIDLKYAAEAERFLNENYKLIDKAYYLLITSSITKVDLQFIKKLVEKISDTTVLFSKAERETEEDTHRIIAEVEKKLLNECGKNIPVEAISPRLIYYNNISNYFRYKFEFDLINSIISNNFSSIAKSLNNLRTDLFDDNNNHHQEIVNSLEKKVKSFEKKLQFFNEINNENSRKLIENLDVNFSKNLRKLNTDLTKLKDNIHDNFNSLNEQILTLDKASKKNLQQLLSEYEANLTNYINLSLVELLKKHKQLFDNLINLNNLVIEELKSQKKFSHYFHDLILKKLNKLQVIFFITLIILIIFLYLFIKTNQI